MEDSSKKEFRESVSKGDPNSCRVFNLLNQISEELDKSVLNSTLPNYLRQREDENWFNSMCLASLQEFHHLIYERRAENDSTSEKFLTLDAADYSKWYEFIIAQIGQSSKEVLLMAFKILSTMLADYKRKSSAEDELLNEKCSTLFVEQCLVETNGIITATYYSRLIEDEESETIIFSYLADSLELDDKIWEGNFVLEAMKIVRLISGQIRPRNIKGSYRDDYASYHENHFLYGSDCWTHAIRRVMENSCKSKMFALNFWNHFENRYKQLSDSNHIEMYPILTLMGISSNFLINGGLEQEKLRAFIKRFCRINNYCGVRHLSYAYFISRSHKLECDEETAKMVVPYFTYIIKHCDYFMAKREASNALRTLLENDTLNWVKRILRSDLDELHSTLVDLTIAHKDNYQSVKLYSTIIEMQTQFDQLPWVS